MGTDKSFIGKKVIMSRFGKDLIATIVRLDSSYPKTAYSVVWTKEDNPNESFRSGSHSWFCVTHYKNIKAVI